MQRNCQELSTKTTDRYGSLGEFASFFRKDGADREREGEKMGQRSEGNPTPITKVYALYITF